MPSYKVSKNISELQADIGSNSLGSSIISHTLKSLRLSVNFSEFNFLKKQGYAFDFVLSTMRIATRGKPAKSLETFNALK